jgi:hypothetical protein
LGKTGKTRLCLSAVPDFAGVDDDDCGHDAEPYPSPPVRQLIVLVSWLSASAIEASVPASADCPNRNLVTTPEPPTPQDVLAPVDFIAVEFPGGVPSAEGFDQLLDLVDRNVIRILDVEFISKDPTGVQVVSVSDLRMPPGVDLSAWDGSSSGLLDADDIATIGAEMQTGSIVAVVVFENVWVLSVVESWSRSGARLILDGAIPASDLIDALDATEST